MKAVLISPTLIMEAPMPLAMLAPIFKEAGYEVKAVVNTFKKPLAIDDMLSKAEGADIVGISMMTFEVLKTYELVRRLKEKGHLVIMGGPHPTDCPEECIEAGADVVVVGEGEAVLKKWLQDTSKRGILDREPPVDLQSLHLPDLSIFDPEMFRDETGLIRGFHRIYTSRGCPGCLRGDTIIHTIDGDKKIVDLVGKNTKVLTRDPKTQNPIYKDAFNIRKTRGNSELVRVHFIDNSYIDCTPDHKFKVFKSKNQYINEKEWDVEAKDLLPKQQVRAVREETNKGAVNHKVDYVEILNVREDVYCMEIPDIHWFYANNVLVHNCCSFCDWQVFKQNFRFYPVDDIIAEIKRRRDEYGITSFSIADDCFTIGKSRVYEFCEKIKPLNVKWRANSRANLADEDMFRAMKDAGCHSVAFGLENGDPETLKKIRKMVTLEQNIEAPWMAHRAGLEVYGCMMTGFPWENVKHIKNNIEFLKKTWDAVSLYQVSGGLMPFPGTEIYKEYHEEHGFTKYWLRDDYQNFGIQVYQNATNPLAMSTLYQRYLWDDTYIQNDYFFTYKKEYKMAVREFAKAIGRHNLPFMFKSHLKAKLMYFLCLISMKIYDINPNIEMKIGGWLYDKFGHGRTKVESLREKRRGIVKTYNNPN